MPRRGINGGPGRTRTFDLPIMSQLGTTQDSLELGIIYTIGVRWDLP